MNQKTLKKNISSTQATYAPEKAMLYNRGLSYRFEIMDDGNIYSISFNAGLTQEETKKILESIQNCLYEKAAGCIQIYLEQNNIAYTGFVASRKPLSHSKAMKLTELFLHSENCISLDTHTSNADIYYAIIDHQQSDNKGKCEGCYIVVQKTPVLSKCQHKYSIIGQTFSCSETNSEEYGYFAIRESKENELINNIALSSGEPVLPSFGCIDLPILLLNIDNIQRIEQVIEIAVK